MKIEVKSAKKSFGENVVFDNVNVEFSTGNFYLIKGINGSGKTVFLKCLCGYFVLDSGDILQDNIKIRDKNNFIQNAGIIIETPSFLEHLTVLENLNLLKKMSKKITDEKIDLWIRLYKIEKFKNTKYKNCSLGTKQKLLLIQAFIHEPELLILDEPFNSLDIESVNKTFKYLSDIKKDSIIILSTHINDNVNYISDEEYLFEDGVMKKI